MYIQHIDNMRAVNDKLSEGRGSVDVSAIPHEIQELVSL